MNASTRLHIPLRTSVRTVRLPCDQPVDIDGFRLTDSVCSGLCLEIVLRVPVTAQGGEERGRDGGRERWKRREGGEEGGKVCRN
jgi:hypothetical protein